MPLQLIRTDTSHPDLHPLIAALDGELAVRDGHEHSFYAQFNKLDTITTVVLAFDNKTAVGCGAFKPFDSRSAEIKRMFVLPDYRNRGIAGMVLRELEQWAFESGFSRTVLETGLKQPEAIHLYQKSGYSLIPNYGQYAGVANSICLQKNLSEPD